MPKIIRPKLVDDHRAAERFNVKRAKELAALAAHEARVSKTILAAETGRVPGVKLTRRKPFDVEDGRYRFARRMPGATYKHEGMPHGAPYACPRCGAIQPAYRQRGRYHCTVNRLVSKLYGCGYRWLGVANPSESPLEASAAAEWVRVPDDSETSYSAILEALDVPFT